MSVVHHNVRQYCAMYFIAPPSFLVEIELMNLRIGEDDSITECNGHDFINLIDGWYYNLEYIPHYIDHLKTIDERTFKACQTETIAFLRKGGRRFFRTSQNIGQIDYRSSKVGTTITFRIRFHFVKEPCNVFYAVDDIPNNAVYITRNYRQSIICATYFVKELWRPTPIDGLLINVISYNIGNSSGGIKKEQDLKKHMKKPCISHKYLASDWVEFDGGIHFGLTSKMKPDDFQICNDAPIKQFPFAALIRCQDVAIRMVSQHPQRPNNFIQFSVMRVLKNTIDKMAITDTVKEFTCLNKPKSWETFPLSLDPDSKCEWHIVVVVLSIKTIFFFSLSLFHHRL